MRPWFCSASGPQAGRLFTGQSITAGRGAWRSDGSSPEAMGWTRGHSSSQSLPAKVSCLGWLFNFAHITILRSVETERELETSVGNKLGQHLHWFPVKMVKLGFGKESHSYDCERWDQQFAVRQMLVLWSVWGCCVLSFRTRLWDWCQSW